MRTLCNARTLLYVYHRVTYFSVLVLVKVYDVYALAIKFTLQRMRMPRLTQYSTHPLDCVGKLYYSIVLPFLRGACDRSISTGVGKFQNKQK